MEESATNAHRDKENPGTAQKVQGRNNEKFQNNKR